MMRLQGQYSALSILHILPAQEEEEEESDDDDDAFGPKKTKEEDEDAVTRECILFSSFPPLVFRLRLWFSHHSRIQFFCQYLGICTLFNVMQIFKIRSSVEKKLLLFQNLPKKENTKMTSFCGKQWSYHHLSCKYPDMQIMEAKARTSSQNVKSPNHGTQIRIKCS